jgi:Tetratricopeptide repeat
LLLSIDRAVVKQSVAKLHQGRLVEAEVDARRALLSRLKNTGKYNITPPAFVWALGNVLVGQGRYAEAEQLLRVTVEINQTLGIPDDSQSMVFSLFFLGRILTLQQKTRGDGRLRQD